MREGKNMGIMITLAKNLPQKALSSPPASRSQRDRLAVGTAAARQSPTSHGTAEPAIGAPAQQCRLLGEGGQS